MPASSTSKKTVKTGTSTAVKKETTAVKVSTPVKKATATATTTNTAKAAATTTAVKKAGTAATSVAAKKTATGTAVKTAATAIRETVTAAGSTADTRTATPEVVTADTAAMVKEIAVETKTDTVAAVTAETLTANPVARILDLASEKKMISLDLEKITSLERRKYLPGTAATTLTPFNGEFRGDVTRSTFDPSLHYSAVLMQQGRVQLDADWNEQAGIVLHYLRALARDMIGPFGGPADDAGFGIGFGEKAGELNIGAGHYYVDGILCENERIVSSYSQPDYRLTMEEQEAYVKGIGGVPILVYLDVWERHITFISNSRIREVALCGPDTATRSRIVWQVKSLPVQPSTAAAREKLASVLTSGTTGKSEIIVTSDTTGDSKTPGNCETICSLLADLISPDFFRNGSCPRLKARAKIPADPSQVCVVQPDARYRGAENQLYRVEIHKPGALADKPTFKWSRDNSTVVFPVVSMTDKTATLEFLGRDDRSTLQAGDWVELLDEDLTMKQKAGNLLQIGSVDRSDLTVTFSSDTGSPVILTSATRPVLRRWDQRQELLTGRRNLSQGAIPVEESEKADDSWFELEDGVQVQFQPGGYYNTGDYWLIPARTASGDIEWPGTTSYPGALPPHGIVHHYAPLALVYNKKKCDCRCKFTRPCGSKIATLGALTVAMSVNAVFTNGVYILLPENKSYAVKVTVTDKDSQPVQGATVSLEAGKAGVLSDTTGITSSNGILYNNAGNSISVYASTNDDGAVFALKAVATMTGYDPGSAVIQLRVQLPNKMVITRE
jgi:hypothetical protein